MRCLAAALFLCLAVPAKGAPVDQFTGDRYRMAYGGGYAADVVKAVRVKRANPVKAKKTKKTRRPVYAPPLTVAIPRARPAGAPGPDEEAAAVNDALHRIIGLLNPIVTIRTIITYADHILRPVGNCREIESLDPRVRQIVNDAARHFNGTALATSCYRSAEYNARIYRRMGRKPTRSLHIARKAIDFKIAGVSKHDLARYVRRHKYAGGVGLYCNSIVHVDVGKRRSWNWCGRRTA